MRPEDLTDILDLLRQVSARLANLPVHEVRPTLRSEIAGAQVRTASLTISLLSVQRSMERPGLIQRPRDKGNEDETVH
jgi:hypothetical protein